jgi:hypothetical protein
MPCLKECELRRCFDSLCNDALLEVFSHINYGANDGRVIGVVGNLTDEGLVNFQDINGKLAKITQAGTLLDYKIGNGAK